MPSFNRLIAIGNLTRDPEIRYVDGGSKSVAKFTIAINRKTKGADEVTYLDCVAWDKLGETCNQYLKKGDPCLVEGRLVMRKYDDKDGNKRTAVECVMASMQMLRPKNAAGGAQSSGAPSTGGYHGNDGQGGDGFGEYGSDDEIPF